MSSVTESVWELEIPAHRDTGGDQSAKATTTATNKSQIAAPFLPMYIDASPAAPSASKARAVLNLAQTLCFTRLLSVQKQNILLADEHWRELGRGWGWFAKPHSEIKTYADKVGVWGLATPGELKDQKCATVGAAIAVAVDRQHLGTDGKYLGEGGRETRLFGLFGTAIQMTR
ncbi:hypothetical protein B0H19DRAFT_1064338 [Mycena capillaripes]|nr:hypothetical protein B0H19DRAFT_1064338 [Mycena capillaripes]